MQKYSAVLEISRFWRMTDDVTRDKHVEMVRISCIFHTKLEIHKFDFLERILIILYENIKLYGKTPRNSKIESNV